jgi:hypothetical protein
MDEKNHLWKNERNLKKLFEGGLKRGSERAWSIEDEIAPLIKRVFFSMKKGKLNQVVR